MKKLKFNKQITNRTELSVDRYLKEINKEPLLSPREEEELARRIQSGSREAFEKLVRSNLRFVVSVAKKYQYQGLALPDLINEGNLGLLKAAERFDETRGFKFISYAVWWIRQSILQAIADKGRAIRIPSNKLSAVSRLDQAQDALKQEHEREPTPEEMGRVLDWAPAEIYDLLACYEKPLSTDAPLDQEEANNLYDVLTSKEFPSPDKNIREDSIRQEIQRILDHQLTEKESIIIQSYYGLGNNRPHRLEEIGRKLSLTSERVRQIRKRAIEKLRGNINLKNLRNNKN